mgnify:FL=1
MEETEAEETEAEEIGKGIELTYPRFNQLIAILIVCHDAIRDLPKSGTNIY